jgi:hypothetical protein
VLVIVALYKSELFFLLGKKKGRDKATDADE